MRSLTLALAGWLLACSGTGPAAPSPTPPDPPALTPAEGPVLAPLPRGAPHASAIDRIELSPDGRAAITRDLAGRLRFWPALDGSAEPVPLPVNSASQLALARATGGQESGWTIALLDTAGAAHLFFAGVGGAATRLFDLPPRLGVLDVRVMPGGQRIALLRRDRVIEIRAPGGRLLAKYDRRQFSPARIDLAGPDHLVAIEVSPGATEASLTLHRLRVEPRAAGDEELRIVPAGGGHEIAVPSFAIDRGQAGASPRGDRYAFLSLDRATSKWRAVIASLETGDHSAIDLDGTPHHQSPGLGFVSDRSLMVRGGNGGITWLIDVEDESVEAVAARADPAPNPPRAFAPGRMVVGMGSWLYSFEPGAGARYLGYEAFSPLASAVSPSGELAAWAHGSDLWIETPRGGAHFPDLQKEQAIRHISFVDERRVALVYHTGAVELFDWKSGRSLADHDGGGSFTSAGYDAERRLLFVIPIAGQVWVTEVEGDRLAGPHLVADGATRAGFLSGEEVLWTLDAANRMRRYRLAEIRAGLSSRELNARGFRIQPVPPIAIGPGGSVFAVHYRGGRNALMVYPRPEPPADPGTAGGAVADVSGTERASTPAVAGVTRIAPSPAGDVIAAVSGTLLVVQDSGDLEVRWSYPLPNGVRNLEWSADGRWLSASTQEGGVVFRARDGERVVTRCALRFSARRTPPPNLFVSNAASSVCER